MESREIWMELL